jgi:hypothetical protein
MLLNPLNKSETIRQGERRNFGLEQVPASIANLIRRIEIAIDTGWMPSRVAVSRVPQRLRAHLGADPTTSPLYQPFKSFPGAIENSGAARPSG